MSCMLASNNRGRSANGLQSPSSCRLRKIDGSEVVGQSDTTRCPRGGQRDGDARVAEGADLAPMDASIEWMMDDGDDEDPHRPRAR